MPNIRECKKRCDYTGNFFCRNNAPAFPARKVAARCRAGGRVLRVGRALTRRHPREGQLGSQAAKASISDAENVLSSIDLPWPCPIQLYGECMVGIDFRPPWGEDYYSTHTTAVPGGLDLPGCTMRQCAPVRTCIVFLDRVQNLRIHAVRARSL